MTARYLTTTVALAAATMGCAEGSSEQIWAFYLGAQTVEDDSQTLSHNFTDAYEPDSASDWDTIGDQTESESIQFGEIVDLGNGETLLVIQGRTYLGATSEGATTYSWDSYSTGDALDSHAQGYTFRQDWDDHVTNKMALSEAEAKGTLTGSWTVTSTTDDGFAEDDTWDTSLTGQGGSQIPTNGYLVIDDGFGNESAAGNSPVDTDCDSDPCTLNVATKTVLTREVTAVLTNYTADDLDRNLENSGQAAGQ